MIWNGEILPKLDSLQKKIKPASTTQMKCAKLVLGPQAR